MFKPHFPDLLSIEDDNYRSFVDAFIRISLQSDRFSEDASSCLVSDTEAEASLIANCSGVFAGAEEVNYLIAKFSAVLKLEVMFEDGDGFVPGDVLLKLKGSSVRILSLERFLINLISRMCGIATTARAYTSQVENVGVLLTRKTVINLIDKKAGIAGGALSHRLNLAHALMVKDNHIAAVGINAALERISDSKAAFVEIEVDTPDQAREVCEALKRVEIPKGMLFDNFAPQDLAALLPTLELEGIFTEASGGINLDTIKEFDLPGLGFVSCGAITMNPQAIDLSLKLETM